MFADRGTSSLKNRTFFLLSTIVLLTAFSAASVPAQNGSGSAVRPTRSETATVPEAGVVTTDRIEDDFSEALSVIEANYFGGKKLNYNDVVKTAIDSALHTLDPHSNYFDAKENEQFRVDQSSRYFGIGATIGDLSDEKGNVIATYIKATFDGAPANRAGLRYGDKIVEVNGVSMLGKPYPEVRNALRGPRGTIAKMVVEHLATGQRETVEITRDAVAQPSISEAYMIRPGVGYMAMRGGFNQTTYAEFVTGMRRLKSEGMQQLILDLRDNGGGLVGQAFYVAKTFLSSGQTIFTQRGRLEGVTEPYRSDNRFPERVPLVVLVNRNTASASEILSGALQDHDRALIVGESTFGKGLVQNPFQLDYGSMLLLTIAKYETPSGRLIQRDYSNGELYNYYTEGGSLRDENDLNKHSGPASKTDTGRSVFSGGGINPDVDVKPQTIPIERARIENRMASPIFAFAMNLVTGRVKGFENYKIERPILFDYDIKKTDYPVTQGLYNAYKQFAATNYKISGAATDSEREFVERMLRTELITAAFGSQTSQQVFNEYDTTLLRGIELLPQAKALAIEAMKARNTTPDPVN